MTCEVSIRRVRGEYGEQPLERLASSRLLSCKLIDGFVRLHCWPRGVCSDDLRFGVGSHCGCHVWFSMRRAYTIARISDDVGSLPPVL